MIALDTETALISVGNLAPPLTCVTWAIDDEEGLRSGLMQHFNAEDQIFNWLEDRQLVGLNMPYDMMVIAAEFPDVLPLIFEAYRNDQITDVGLRQKLIDIAKGQFRGYTDAVSGHYSNHEYSLAALSERHLGITLDKHTHRLRFGELRDVPVKQWPEGAAEYAIDDAEVTLSIWQKQEEDAHLLEDQYRQARAALGLHLISCWGIRTDPAKIVAFTGTVEGLFEEAVEHCTTEGLVRGDGSRDTKKARQYMLDVLEEIDAPIKRTKSYVPLRRKRDAGEELTKRNLKDLEDPLFGVSCDEEACTGTGDPLLISYSRVSSLKTVVQDQIPALWNGTTGPIQPRFDSLVETGRTSCKGYSEDQPTNGYQMHNVRRLPGIRECFTARPGTVYADADFSGLELFTWAQVCLWALGESRLAQALNAGEDAHLILGSELMGVPYEEARTQYFTGDEAASDARQFAKIGNFGFMGGMQPPTFRSWARQQYGVHFSEEFAEQIHQSWHTTWPEAQRYFIWIKALCDAGSGYATVTQFMSERVRGLIPFTVTANGFFQGLGADIAKDALFEIQRECYINCGTALYGCRMVNFVHDEYMIEVPEEIHAANAAADRMVEVMVEVAQKWLPDLNPGAEVALMKHWSKKAKPVRNAEGLLIPWEQAA